MIKSSSQELFKFKDRIDIRDIIIIFIFLCFWIMIEFIYHYSFFLIPKDYSNLNLYPFRYNLSSFIDYKDLNAYMFFDISREAGVCFNILVRSITYNNLISLGWSSFDGFIFDKCLNPTLFNKETIFVKFMIYISQKFIWWFNNSESGFNGINPV